MKNYKTSLVVVLLGIMCSSHSIYGLDLTACTVFSCNNQGEMDNVYYVHTGPADGIWDIFLYEGDVFNPAKDDPGKIKWLNNTDNHTIHIPLMPGIYTYTFHSEFDRIVPFVGMNLFFDNNEQADISILTEIDRKGQLNPDIKLNRAKDTMGWSVRHIPATVSREYGAQQNGIWHYFIPQAGLKVFLKSFRFSAPSVDGDLDLVGKHQTGSSGKADWVGQFVLEVKEYTPHPTELFLWLQTNADLTLGAPDYASQWKQKLDYKNVQPPFSFTYAGESSNSFLKKCNVTKKQSASTLGRDRIPQLSYRRMDSLLYKYRQN